MRYLLSLFCLLGFALPSVCQETIVIIENFSSESLHSKNIRYYEDITGVLPFERVTKKKFVSPLSDNINFGYSSSSYWIKLSIDNSKNSLCYLNLSYSLLDSASLYWQNKSGNWEREVSGDLVPFSQRLIKHRNILFPIKNGLKEYYLRIKSNGPILTPLKIQSSKTLLESQTTEEGVITFFYGIMSVMVIYNFFLYLSFKDDNYLYYSITILLNIIAQACVIGHAMYFWGDWIEWTNIAVVFFLYLTVSFFCIFSINFLSIKKYSSVLYYLINTTKYISFLLCFSSFFIPYTLLIRLASIIVSLNAISILIAGIYVWKKGRTSARLFVFAWFLYILGVVTISLRNFALLPDNVFTRHLITIGSVFEVVFISFALAERLNILRLRTEEAQKVALEQSRKSLELINQQNEILNYKVQERTQTLQAAYQEVDAYRIKMKSSVNSAYTIQQAILPSHSTLERELNQFFVFNQPKDEVSGDFYWFAKIEKQHFFAVIDCTGHGISGAFMTMIVKSLLDQIVKVLYIHEASQILLTLHEEIQKTLHQKETKNKDGLDMSLCIWEWDQEAVTVHFAGAKRPLYYATPFEKTLTKVPGSRKSIGGNVNESKNYATIELNLPTGTQIFMTSDGYADQNNEAREKFSEKKLLELLSNLLSLPPQEQIEKLDENLKKFSANTEQRDDILIVGIKL